LFALVVPEIESGLYLSLQTGMEAAARANREQLITMTTGGSTMQQADSILQLIDRDVAGIALVPSYEPAHAYQLRHLHRSGVPLVLLHRGVPNVPAPLINIPFAVVGKLAGEVIGECGHKSVAAFVGAPSETTTAYLDGFRRGLQKHQITLAEENVSYTEAMLISAEDYSRYSQDVDVALTSLLARQDRPTAIFVTFDRMAEMIYAVVTTKGLRIPDDISLVCFGGNRRIGPILPHVATVAVDELAAGREAYELLSAMHRGERPLVSEETFTMSVFFDPAASLGSPKQSRRQECDSTVRARP
jgi:DNA-binding LacI/PurR family transcriptional regulator